jgi:hypothetical protein
MPNLLYAIVMPTVILQLQNTHKTQDVKERRDEELLVLPTDAMLFEDPAFKVGEHTHIGKNCTPLGDSLN